MPSAEAVISSPGLRHFGGSKRAPAQVGVPRLIISPGTRVVRVEMSAICQRIRNSILPVRSS